MRSSKLPECIVMVQTMLVQRRAFSFEIAGFRRAAACCFPGRAPKAVRRRPCAEGARQQHSAGTRAQRRDPQHSAGTRDESNR